MQILISIVAFVLLLGILVFVHELGHFLAAKRMGMRVDKFSIGFPPYIWRKRKGDTLYVLGVIPFGGFVQIHGENPEDGDDDDPHSFENRPVAARMFVILAGICMNVAFAFVVLSVAFSVGFTSFAQDLSTVPGATVLKERVLISDLVAGGTAEKAGIVPGDVVSQITAANGSVTAVHSREDLINQSKALQAAGDTKLTLTVTREGVVSYIPVGIAPSGPALGVYVQMYNVVRVPVYRAPEVAVKEMGAIFQVTWEALANFGKRLFTQGQLDPNVSGPVGIYQATAAATRTGFDQVVFLAVALSLNLALLNVLPIPALDGGRFVFLVVEGVFKRRVIAKKIEQWVVSASFLLLMGLFVVLTVRDVWKLF